MKDGKISISDADKYRQLATQKADLGTVPEVLQKAFEKAALAHKWVSKAKIANHHGRHPSDWIPYEISEEQKAGIPRQYAGSVVGGHLERGDLVLAVKPKEMLIDQKQRIQNRTKLQVDSLFEQVDERGKPMLYKGEQEK
jgi:hypothetical protein